MKWIAKFRTSFRLDSMQAEAGNSAPDPGFLEIALALERSLKQGRPSHELPSGLHDSIMRKVRQSGEPESPPRQWAIPRFAVAGMGLVLLATAAWLSWLPTQRQTPHPAPFASAEAALGLGTGAVRDLPLAATAPLEKELQRLDEDVFQAAEYLWARFP